MRTKSWNALFIEKNFSKENFELNSVWIIHLSGIFDQIHFGRNSSLGAKINFINYWTAPAIGTGAHLKNARLMFQISDQIFADRLKPRQTSIIGRRSMDG